MNYFTLGIIIYAIANIFGVALYICQGFMVSWVCIHLFLPKENLKYLKENRATLMNVHSFLSLVGLIGTILQFINII